MRRRPTGAEGILWERLRNRALGVRFRRQHAIDRFIVDFCCLEAKLVIEADGPIHNAQGERDGARDVRLHALGFQVLRFTNAAVETEIDTVLTAIEMALQATKPTD